MSTISQRIKHDRKELNLMQQDCAMLLGVSRVTYIKWEQDPGTMPLGKYEKLLTEFERLKQIKGE